MVSFGEFICVIVILAAFFHVLMVAFSDEYDCIIALCGPWACASSILLLECPVGNEGRD